MEQDRLSLEMLRGLIAAGPEVNLSEALQQRPYGEVAAVLEEVPLDEQLEVMRRTDRDLALNIFEHLETDTKIELLKLLRQRRTAFFLEEMSPDERADLFHALPEALSERLLKLLPEEERADVARLVKYEANTAGGLMTSDFVRIRAGMTVREALRHFREFYHDIEMVYYFYVLDERGRLEGVVSLRQMISSDGDALIRDIMGRHVLSVNPETDQEVVAEELSLYDFYALPVTDDDNIMLGIVTFDDLMDVLEQEAAEDHDYFAGLTPVSDEGPPTTLMGQMWRRLPWLIGFLILGSISGFVLDGYMRLYARWTDGLIFFGALTTLLPMLTGTSGNAGTQSVTLSLEALSTGRRDWNIWKKVLSQEARVGLVMGPCLAVIAFMRGILTSTEKAMFLSLSVACAIVVCVVTSTSLGALLPILCKRLNLDPAVISSPLITSLMDVLAVTIYFAMAILFMPYFL